MAHMRWVLQNAGPLTLRVAIETVAAALMVDKDAVQRALLTECIQAARCTLAGRHYTSEDERQTFDRNVETFTAQLQELFEPYKGPARRMIGALIREGFLRSPHGATVVGDDDPLEPQPGFTAQLLDRVAG